MWGGVWGGWGAARAGAAASLPTPLPPGTAPSIVPPSRCIFPLISQLEKNIVAAGSMTQMLNEGLTVADITGLLLEGLGGNDTGFQLQPR